MAANSYMCEMRIEEMMWDMSDDKKFFNVA